MILGLCVTSCDYAMPFQMAHLIVKCSVFYKEKVRELKAATPIAIATSKPNVTSILSGKTLVDGAALTCNRIADM